jgi:hypothetical protein
MLAKLHNNQARQPLIFDRAVTESSQIGTRVVDPLILFGPVDIKTTELDRVTQLAKLCNSSEFHVLTENRSSPIVDWLRALACHTSNDRCDGSS